MQPFATEFPVKASDNKAAFLAEVFAWLRGMKDSKVLASTSERELDGENVHLLAETGEELRMRELKSEGKWIAVGFQHEMPDNQGRLWRTEAVLKRGNEDTEQPVVRFKTQCLAKRAGAFLETPKKPFLVKGLLKASWGGLDGDIDVCDEPLWLEDEDDDVGLAAKIVSGKATRRLPVVYVSAIGWDECVLSQDQITKLAYDLGGVAHVVVEPNRSFSLRLKDATQGRNIYNGSIAVALPDRGFIRRFYLGRHLEQVSDLIDAVRATTVQLRSFMPADGWDWTELQEHALRAQRVASRGALSQGDADQLLDDFTRQLEELQEENRRLNRQLNSLAVSDIAKEERAAVADGTVPHVIKEIYLGEVTDRIRFAAQTALTVAEANGVDARTVAVWNRILERVPRSQGLDDLLAELSRATKDRKRMAMDLTTLLQRHGFRSKSENRHVRLEAEDGFDGLQSITISKTPSEARGLKNQRKQIERNLGIGNLPGDVRDNP